MNKVEEANFVLGQVKEEEVILMCSLGKDSLVALDLASRKFKKIYCVFMYFVKGLEHIERWISWVKTSYSNIEFIQVPHWNLTHILRDGLYCVPNPNIKLLTLTDVCRGIRAKLGISNVILGMKKADSMNRRLMLTTYNERNRINNGFVYPLANWTQKDVLAYMKQHKLPTPVRYSKNASNGLGFNLDCFLWLRKNYPQDLQRIIKTFPLSERILFENDNK